MTDPSWPLQQALYQALSNALPCPVYDAVPQGAAFPYVTLDREVRRSADYLSSRMDERFVYLNVWSDYPGQKEVKEIIAAIDAALHRQPLTLATGRVVSCIVRDTDTSRDADGTTYMGRVTLQVLTQH